MDSDKNPPASDTNPPGGEQIPLGSEAIPAGEVTQILERVGTGDERALDRLLPLIYDELRSLAAVYMRKERPDHTLQATALLHEAFIRMKGGAEVQWQNRAHFMAAAAKTMRRVLVDHARGKNRQKRGGGWERVTLSPIAGGDGDRTIDVIALNEALDRLERDVDERKARVVEMLYIGGMTAKEAGEVLGIDTRTVERDWKFARAWLLKAMTEVSIPGESAPDGDA